MSKSLVENVLLRKIRIDGDTHSRLGIVEDVVEEYTKDMRRGDEFPPVEVVFDGRDYWLCDGFHRYKAARLAGRRIISAVVRPGSRQYARWRCLGANAVHGLRRSNADKAWAVCRAIKLRPDRSDRFIAAHVAVDHKTVASERAGMESTGEIPHLPRRRGLDGRWRPAESTPARTYGWLATGEILQSADRRRRGRYGGRLPDVPHVDSEGHSLEGADPRLVEVFDRQGEIHQAIKLAQRLQDTVLRTFDRSSPVCQTFDWNLFDTRMEQILGQLRWICPHSICPQCNGAGCNLCGGGWLNREVSYQATSHPCALPPPVEIAG